MPFLGKGCHSLLRVFPKQEAKQGFLKKHRSHILNQATDQHSPVSPRQLGCLCRAGGGDISCQCYPLPLQISAVKSVGTKSKSSLHWSVLPQEPRSQLGAKSNHTAEPAVGHFSSMWTPVWFHFHSHQGKTMTREHSTQRCPLISVHPAPLNTFTMHKAAALYKLQ